MSVVTDQKLINELDKLRLEKKPQEVGGNVISEESLVTDKDEIKELEELRKGNTISGKIKKFAGATKDFFTGTKKTEFIDMPEIGEYQPETLGQGFLVSAGMLINPNQKAQAQIIQSQIPDSKIFKDRFDNLIVNMPDGKNYYLNKPGASQQDILQTTAQILQYIPGYSWAMKKAGKSYLGKVLGSGAAGGATSLAQDIATKPLGSKDMDYSRAVISTIVPVAFEGAVSPVVSKVYKKIMGNPKFTETVKVFEDGVEKTRLVLNKKGKEAAKAAGLDETKLNQKFIRDFTEKLSQGEKPQIASSQAGGGQFNFRLARAQAAGDEEGIALLFEAAKGSYGKEPQKQAIEFLKKQDIDIENSATNLIKRFDRGQFNIESLEDAGQEIIQGLSKRYTAASNEVKTAYNFIDKDGVFQASNSNIDTLVASVRKSIEDATAVIDKELTPATIKAQKIITDFVKKYKPKKAQKTDVGSRKIKEAVFNDFVVLKRKLNGAYNASKNNTDRRNVKAVIDEWEKFVDDNVDNLIFSGKENGVELLKKANALFKKKKELFEINNKKINGLTVNDKAGKVVMKILNENDVTPNKAIDYIFGRANIGRLDESLSVVKRLKKIFGVEGKDLSEAAAKNKDFQALRTGFWEKLVRDSSKNAKFNAKNFYNNWKTVSQKNKDLLDELFDADEIKLIDKFANEVEKTFPKGFINASNTASALSRIIQQVGRGLFGIFGFKFANIQGLLVARGGFDRARDIISEKQAAKLVNQELAPIFGTTANPRINTLGTVGAQQGLESMRIRNARQLPPSIADMYRRY